MEFDLKLKSDDVLIAALYAIWAYRQQSTMRGATLCMRIYRELLTLPNEDEYENSDLEWAIEDELDKRQVTYLR